MRPDNLNLTNPALVLLMLALLCLLFYAVAPGVAQGNMLQQIEEEFQKVVASARPAVVKVVATHQIELPQFPPDAQKKPVLTRQSIGSGIVIDTAGHVVTTTFDADVHKVEVVFHDGSSADAKLLGEDIMMDIAVLRVNTGAGRSRPHMRPGNSSNIDSGSWVVTVGNSYGASPIISFGVVGGWDILPKHPCAEVIKINAPVTPGNSGGAVVNTAGEVVGMILAVLTESSPSFPTVVEGSHITKFHVQPVSQGWVTFAIPIETVTALANEIIAHGKVARGWLGVQIEVGESGVFITRVTEDGPAHKSGLLPKDVILEFNNHRVEDYPQLLQCVMSTSPNTQVRLKIYREGRVQMHAVTLGER